jgi:phosphate acetyltransferase
MPMTKMNKNKQAARSYSVPIQNVTMPTKTMPPRRRHSSPLPKARHVFYLVPTCPDVGLTSVSLGLVRALDREGLHVGFFKPIRQPTETGPERSTHFLRATGDFHPPEPWTFQQAESLLKSGNEARLLQDIVEQFENSVQDAAVVVVEGLQPTAECPELETLNHLIVKALDAEIIIVSTLQGTRGKASDGDIFSTFDDRVEHVANQYGGIQDSSVLGCIVNKFNAPVSHVSGAHLDELPSEHLDAGELIYEKSRLFKNDDFCLIGAVPWDNKMLSIRAKDMAEHLGAKVIHEGELKTRRITDVKVVARTIKNMIFTLRPNTLICTPADRDDVILAVCMGALNGIPLAGLVLTGGYEPEPNVLKLCEKAFQTGLPLLTVETDSYITAARAAAINQEVPIDDLERIEGVMDHIAERMCVAACLFRRIAIVRESRLSPAAFMYQLVNRARAHTRRIVLPEGHEPRIIKAAAICHERKIAQCVLLGDPVEINRLAEAQGINLPRDIEILQPNLELRQKYAEPMVKIRKHKGLTSPMALAQLEDTTVLGTMMLATGEVEGLVSGAVNSTANTVRPALQFIKTHPDANIISSIFFMCLPNQVLIYGDCAINPDPNAEQLADIALQSAASAEAFGIEPRVAIMSYSTGSSGKGSDVDKVREATRIAKERRPDLLIDGPLQYDAACNADVARSKAPDSCVAGRATVLIFPDLNTGNTTYKAVQRTANAIAVGPMLQGLNRPVNDLSRGALVDDIVYTIALTAIQVGQTAGDSPLVPTPLPADSSQHDRVRNGSTMPTTPHSPCCAIHKATSRGGNTATSNDSTHSIHDDDYSSKSLNNEWQLNEKRGDFPGLHNPLV